MRRVDVSSAPYRDETSLPLIPWAVPKLRQGIMEQVMLWQCNAGTSAFDTKVRFWGKMLDQNAACPRVAPGVAGWMDRLLT